MQVETRNTLEVEVARCRAVFASYDSCYTGIQSILLFMLHYTSVRERLDC